MANGKTAVLDGSVRMLQLQFSFSNRKLVPALVRWADKETAEKAAERAIRKANPTQGVEELIPATMNVSIADFLVDLLRAGYDLVDALYQPRHGKNGTYHMVRFVFCQKEFVLPNEEFARKRELIMDALCKLCVDAFWRVRASTNPFYDKGIEQPGQRFVSINLEKRTPFLQPDGTLVVQWRRDPVSGDRIGSAPVPLKPDHTLRITDGTIWLHQLTH